MIFADMGAIEGYWRQLLLHICQPIYKLIVYLYELFEVVGTADIITSETLDTLYDRVGMILGLYMMFRIILSFIQMLVNPDNISDKEKGVGKIFSRAILTIVLLAITPYIFEKAFELQNYIVGTGSETNVIAKLIFPDKMVKSDSFGPVLSAYLFESFYRYDDYMPPGEEGVSPRDCEAKQHPMRGDSETVHSNLFNSITRSKGSVSYARICLFDSDDYSATWSTDDGEERYKISFTWNGVFAIIVGLVVCYTLLTYTLSVGARVIQLAFLRIISPMAILGYLSPKKDNMFEKWLKMCTTTYLDLFIRMAIIYFVVFLIDILMTAENGIALKDGYDHVWIVSIVMIVSLLLFAKKAPELLKELFPKSGAASLGFGLKSPKSLLNDMVGGKQLWNASKRATGFGLGALAGGAIGFLGGRGAKGRASGLFGGVARGAFNGSKQGSLMSNLKGVGTKQVQVNKQKIDWANNGSTWSGRMKQRAANAFGYAGSAESIENQINNYDKDEKDKNGTITSYGLNSLNAQATALNKVTASRKAIKEEANKNLREEAFAGEGEEKARSLSARYMNAEHIANAMKQGQKSEALNIAQSEYNRIDNELTSLSSSGITSGDDEYDKLVEQKNKTADTINKINNAVTIDNINEKIDTLKEDSIVKEYIKIANNPNPSDDELSLKNVWETEFEQVKEYLNLSSQIDNLNESSYTSTDAVNDMYKIQSEMVTEYSDWALSSNTDTGIAIRKHASDINNVVGQDNNKEFFNDLGVNLDTTSIASIKELDKVSKKKLAEVEQQIYVKQTAKDALSKSEEKKAADANRSAVGGHSGGNK